MKLFSFDSSPGKDKHRSTGTPRTARGREGALRKGAGSRRHLVVGVLAALALSFVGPIGPVFADPPTVNGLFYGDGDDAKYQLYATSVGGSGLYIYLDIPTRHLYVALVVSHAINDLVCTDSGNRLYTDSAGWGQHRSCKRASDSEFATFTFECAPGSPRSWTWQQALGCALNPTEPASDFVTDSTCGPSSPAADWPPGITAASSWVTNANTYQSAYPYGTPWPPSPAPPWNLYVNGIDFKKNWKSPFVTSAPDDVTQVTGYPTHSSYNQINPGVSQSGGWEWSMVYEWSIDMGSGGTDCGGQLIYVLSGTSHHSPPKSGDQNDDFPPQPNPILSDWGDLPDVYGTFSTSTGPAHYIKIDGPYLGADIQAEADGQPTTDATGDGVEEDGITAVVDSDWTAGSTQTISVVVSNAPTGALLGGWFDWNGDGDLTDPDEFFSWNVSEGVNALSVTVGSEFAWATDTLHGRFRLFSTAAAAPGGTLEQADFGGDATDGEVEDYVWDFGTLPVTLNAFSSDGPSGGDITVRWQTASETDNVGFEIWGRVEGRWQALSDFVPSRGMNSRLPNDYEVVVMAPPQLSQLQLVDYNSRGVVERYGPFRLGARRGELQPTRRIDWTETRLEREQRLRARGFHPVGGETDGTARLVGRGETWKNLAEGASEPGRDALEPTVREIQITPTQTDVPVPTKGSIIVAEGRQTHVAVTDPGVQRVTFDALRDGGLDLTGINNREIAVTWRGSPIARWIDGPRVFGPGSAIEFIGHPPIGDDALYISANNYQISVNRRLALETKEIPPGSVPQVSRWYSKETTVDRPIMHHSQSPTGDPWIERTVLARNGAPATVTLDIDVVDEVLGGKHEIVLDLGAITDLPDITGAGGAVVPEHNVEVGFIGPDSGFVPITTASISGQQNWHIEADLPDGLLGTGLNQIQLRFTTEYLFSLVVVDSYSLRYQTPYNGPELDFPPDRRAHGYHVEGFDSPNVVAYSLTREGALTRHRVSVFPSVGGYVAEFRQNQSGSDRLQATVDALSARFWVTETPHRPAVFTTRATGDLFSGQSDLVVIAGSSFVGTPALNAYLASKAEFNPVVVDVEDIYNAVGYGMALPSAITDYLITRREISPYSHVQLVGTDCYDRRNYISQCVSFVPLPTAAVGFTLYSPSHNRLVDLDGDGVADIAVAQFSVRTEDELATIVDKERDWHASDLSSGNSALLIAEESDGMHDFIAQVDRVGRHLDAAIEEVLDMSAHPDIATAREALRTSLDAGRAVTVFSGHSSATMWAYRGLLTSSSAAGLTNFGLPTLMLPLACETSYDVSPTANVLGHQLLYSGDQGALAISGAVSLASLNENERMANHVLAGLESGLTLGQAVQAGREALGSAYQVLQDNWLTQGDVTLKMER